MYDFHCHTTYSDGELIPSELIRRMAYTGYTEMGIADHADFSNVAELIAAQKRVKRSAELYGISLHTGVELTHVPPTEIDELAHLAKSLGAEIVIVRIYCKQVISLHHTLSTSIIGNESSRYGRGLSCEFWSC